MRRQSVGFPRAFRPDYPASLYARGGFCIHDGCAPQAACRIPDARESRSAARAGGPRHGAHPAALRGCARPDPPEPGCVPPDQPASGDNGDRRTGTGGQVQATGPATEPLPPRSVYGKGRYVSPVGYRPTPGGCRARRYAATPREARLPLTGRALPYAHRPFSTRAPVGFPPRGNEPIS